jgi:capsular polysaccharide biosynthesis protein
LNDSETIEIDLRKLAIVLVRHWWVLVLGTLVGGAAALGITRFLITPQYTATVKMYVNNSTESGSSITSSDISASKSLVETYITIIRSDTVLGEVAELTGYGYEPPDLNEMLSAGALNATEVFFISITHPSAVRAAVLANAIADAAPRHLAEIVDGSSLKIVDRAKTPTEPSSPDYIVNTAIGAAAGFLIPSAVFVLLALFDVRINTADDLAALADAPVLGVISDFDSVSHSKYGYGGYGGYAPPGDSQNARTRNLKGSVKEDVPG